MGLLDDTPVTGRVVTCRTIGRVTGEHRETQLRLHRLGEDLYITGRPGRIRDWLANLTHWAEFVLEVDNTAFNARATAVDDVDERTSILWSLLTESRGFPPDECEAVIKDWVDRSPLIRVDTLP